jgi:hypothetical protein
MPEKELDYEYPKMLKFILAREGGYSNRATDKGGETNKGITHSTYDSYRRSKGLPKRSVKYITNEEVEDIYYNNYYKASGADKIENPRLALYVFDTAINMGVSVAKELERKSDGNLEKFEKLRRERYESYAKSDKTQMEYLKGWQNRVTHAKDFAHTVLPQERELPYQLGVEMDVDQNGNVIYYYDMDDYRNMDSDDFKRNFPKILQQTIHQVGHPTGGAANVSRPEGCAGTYRVSGYIRSDGVKVSDYERTCGAKHLGEQKASEKYRGLKVEQMTKGELDELLDELI